jgi:hypothetical protein
MIFFQIKFTAGYFHPEKHKLSKKRIFVPSGLRHDSTSEFISEDGEPIRWLASKGHIMPSENGFIDKDGESVDLERDCSESAFIYVHGLRSVPRKAPISRKVVEFLMQKGKDVYAPLLRFHGTKNVIFSRYNPYLSFEKFKKDLEFLLSLNYKKLYFVAFSHGGLQTVRASLEGLLDHRCSLILLCPQLIFNKERNPINRSLILAINLLTRKFFKFEQETFKMMVSSGLRNNFTYILAGKDVFVSKDLEPFLLQQSGLIKGIVLPEAGHYVPMYPEFYEIMNDYLQILD